MTITRDRPPAPSAAPMRPRGARRRDARQDRRTMLKLSRLTRS